jgi:hypothetical protein
VGQNEHLFFYRPNHKSKSTNSPSSSHGTFAKSSTGHILGFAPNQWIVTNPKKEDCPCFTSKIKFQSKEQNKK